MRISMIVAKAKNNVIGKDNTLIWDIPEDLKHFRKVTTGKTIVMGRKTYDSIGRPLPNRRNIILTRDNNLSIEGTETMTSVDDILNLDVEEIVIIGGDSVYKLFMEYVQTLYVTNIEHEFDGDTFFPEISSRKWKLVTTKGQQEESIYKYEFQKFERIKV